MYDFDNDIATVYTGETDMKMSGLIDTYRRLPRLPHWEGEHCSHVRGASDATKFPSLIQPNDTVYFYRKSVCRAMPTVRIVVTCYRSHAEWLRTCNKPIFMEFLPLCYTELITSYKISVRHNDFTILNNARYIFLSYI
jgi:hypothetical protein